MPFVMAGSIGERKHAVLRTTMPGHDERHSLHGAKKIPAAIDGRESRQELFLLLLEVIVHAGAQRSEPVAVGCAGDDEVAVVEIDIEIFDLGAPVLGEAEFGADARGPADIGVRFRLAKKALAAQFAERQTRGAVEEDVVEGIAATAAHGAEPGIGKLPGRERILGAGRLDVALDAEHPWTGLPVVAGLHAALESRRLGRVVVDRAPAIAEIAAEIGTCPAIGIERLIDGVGSAVRQVPISAAISAIA